LLADDEIHFYRDNRSLIEYHRGLLVQWIMQDGSYARPPSLRLRFSLEPWLHWTLLCSEFPNKEPEKACDRKCLGKSHSARQRRRRHYCWRSQHRLFSPAA